MTSKELLISLLLTVRCRICWSLEAGKNIGEGIVDADWGAYNLLRITRRV
jgi:hypothetical protein